QRGGPSRWLVEVGRQQTIRAGTAKTEGDSGRSAWRSVGAMTMAESDSDREPIEQLAESFLARVRAVERPLLTEFAAAHPELADQIRELFPALLELEQAGSVTGPAAPRNPHGGAALESLGDYRILREVGGGGMGAEPLIVRGYEGRQARAATIPQSGR